MLIYWRVYVACYIPYPQERWNISSPSWMVPGDLEVSGGEQEVRFELRSSAKNWDMGMGQYL